MSKKYQTKCQKCFKQNLFKPIAKAGGEIRIDFSKKIIFFWYLSFMLP